MVQKKKASKKEPEVKRQQTFDLCLTKFELLHVRDLMSVLLPPDGEMTLSKSLASSEGREIIESSLWRKVVGLCEEAQLPLGEEAPDYIIIPTSHPTLGVFQVNHDGDDDEGQEAGSSGFLPEKQEDEEDEE